jgi:hypothetical protein
VIDGSRVLSSELLDQPDSPLLLLRRLPPLGMLLFCHAPSSLPRYGTSRDTRPTQSVLIQTAFTLRYSSKA